MLFCFGLGEGSTKYDFFFLKYDTLAPLHRIEYIRAKLEAKGAVRKCCGSTGDRYFGFDYGGGTGEGKHDRILDTYKVETT